MFKTEQEFKNSWYRVYCKILPSPIFSNYLLLLRFWKDLKSFFIKNGLLYIFLISKIIFLTELQIAFKKRILIRLIIISINQYTVRVI